MEEIKPTKLEEQEAQETHIFRHSVVPLIIKLVVLYAILYLGYFLISLLMIWLRNDISLRTIVMLNILIVFLIFVLIGGVSIYLTLSWFSEMYIIKYPDITVRKGVINITEERGSLEGIGEEVSVTQGALGKIFRYGNIQVGEFKAFDIPDPHHFAEVVTGKESKKAQDQTNF